MSSFEIVELFIGLIIGLFGCFIFLVAIIVSPIMLFKRVIKDDEKDITDVISLIYIVIYNLVYFILPEIVNGFEIHIAFKIVEVVAYLWVAVSLYNRSKEEESDFVRFISIITFIACFISLMMGFIKVLI